jgi:hypothetical protein
MALFAHFAEEPLSALASLFLDQEEQVPQDPLLLIQQALRNTATLELSEALTALVCASLPRLANEKALAVVWEDLKAHLDRFEQEEAAELKLRVIHLFCQSLPKSELLGQVLLYLLILAGSVPGALVHLSDEFLERNVSNPILKAQILQQQAKNLFKSDKSVVLRLLLIFL